MSKKLACCPDCDEILLIEQPQNRDKFPYYCRYCETWYSVSEVCFG